MKFLEGNLKIEVEVVSENERIVRKVKRRKVRSENSFFSDVVSLHPDWSKIKNNHFSA